MNIILLGPPGAGKGTQAERLESTLEIPHISSGDIFRTIRREDTSVAREIQQYMDRGEYVPDGLTNEIVLERLDQPDTKNGFILDGYPRTDAQARALDDALAREGRKPDLALLITVPNEILMERVQGRIVCPNCGAVYNAVLKPPRRDGICDVCGHVLERRTDEVPEVMKTRLQMYFRETQPLEWYYRTRGILVEVDGRLPVGEVNSAVDAALGMRSAT